MKYAKIKNGKVVDVINGLAPDYYVEVIQQWSSPTEYPLSFYVTSSNEPILSIVGEEVHENWSFILKSLEATKDVIYAKQKLIRHKAEDSPINFKGKKIKIKGDKNKNCIRDLNGSDVGLKISSREWLDLNPAEIKALQKALYDSTQNAFKSERIENNKVSLMTTHDELSGYLSTM